VKLNRREFLSVGTVILSFSAVNFGCTCSDNSSFHCIENAVRRNLAPYQHTDAALLKKNFPQVKTSRHALGELKARGMVSEDHKINISKLKASSEKEEFISSDFSWNITRSEALLIYAAHLFENSSTKKSSDTDC
jgi:hypothetical protein